MTHGAKMAFDLKQSQGGICMHQRCLLDIVEQGRGSTFRSGVVR